jgi:broad specificity phosphatase PhoE
MKAHRSIVLIVLVLLTGAPALAQPAIFIVRHAERADTGKAATMMADDPSLSAVGRRRAEALAAVLKDAGITEIFATEYKRTRQTAEPLARQRHIKVQSVPAKEIASLVEKLRAARGNVLVVTHSNSVPEILKALGLAATVSIGESDFDNLFIVSRGTSPTLIRLHYR